VGNFKNNKGAFLMIKADGFDNAIIGIDIISNRIIYSTKKCIEILMKQNN